MTNEKLISLITEAVLRELEARGQSGLSNKEALPCVKKPQALPAGADLEAIERMKRQTTARIGVGNAGPRLRTETLLKLRADHAAARDAVMIDVQPKLIESLGLFSIKTRCRDRDEFLTRPDLGRLIDDDGVAVLKERCIKNPDVQIFAADGLSSRAIEKNLPDILPVILDGLRARNISCGTPFFVKFGRVGSLDHVSEILGPKVTCVLIGERPGLGSAESMSAYMAYNARIGMPEAGRTVVSNIHAGGTPAVEAGAYIAELLAEILEKKQSGVDLKR